MNNTLQKIEIVCKMNQVRSPFLASFFRIHFPFISLTSSGREANETQLQHFETSKIADSWGFPFTVVQSKRFAPSNTTTYFPVDLLTEQVLKRELPESQVISPAWIEYSNFIRMPLDPIGFDSAKLRLELGLLLFHATNIFQNILLPRPRHEIFLYRFTSSKNLEKEILELKRLHSKGGFFLVNLCPKDSVVNSILRENVQAGELLGDSNLYNVFSPKFEMVEEERFLCSVEFREWLQELAETKGVILISPPIHTLEGEINLQSVLCGLWASSQFTIL
jgi:hypothetical protein